MDKALQRTLADRHNEKGLDYFSSGKLDDAIREFSEAVCVAPECANVYANRGEAYNKIGNLDAAIQDYTEAIRLDPNQDWAYLNRAVIYRNKGKLDSAIQDCNEAIRIDPKISNFYINRGEIYRRKGDLEEAIRDCNEAIRLDPNYDWAYAIRGNINSQSGDYGAAIHDFTESLRLFRENPWAYRKRGEAYLQQGYLEAAILDYSDAIRLDPKDAIAFVQRGNTYKLQGNLEWAIRDYSEAIRLDPQKALLYYYRGDSYYEQGYMDAAIHDLNEAIRLDPSDIDALNCRGLAYMDISNLESAIWNFTEAIHLDPENSTIFSNRGVAYSEQGNLKSAIRDFSEAIRLDPGNIDAYNNRGCAYSDQGDQVSANSDFQIASQEKNPEVNKNKLNPPILINNNIQGEISTLSKQGQVNDPDLQSLFDELNNMIGLEQAKAEVHQLVQFVRIQKLRQSKGLGKSNISLHSVFQGNPGTGKTTVARIYAKMLHAMGLLEKGHLVETDRSGLVGNYIGQTATKTDEKVSEALGGVLFIDEAYALYKGDHTEWDYGPEAIEVIMKRMEDHRDNLAVIVAGYQEPMDNFLNSNEGFKSRFVNYIHFDDYSPDELYQIFLTDCVDNQYTLSKDAADGIRKVIDKAYETKAKNFGNARYCRNIFEKIIRNQSLRIGDSINNPTVQQLKMIEAEDISPFLS